MLFRSEFPFASGAAAASTTGAGAASLLSDTAGESDFLSELFADPFDSAAGATAATAAAAGAIGADCGAGAEGALKKFETKLVTVVVVVVIVFLISFNTELPLFPLFPFGVLPSLFPLGFGVPSEGFPSREHTTLKTPPSNLRDVTF